jgi:hypothetical protein
MFPSHPDRRYFSRLPETAERTRGKLEFLYPNVGVVFPPAESPARKLQQRLQEAFGGKDVVESNGSNDWTSLDDQPS